jgi:hypothetical protein
VYTEAITPLVTPAILAKLLDIKAPAKADTEIPDKLITASTR